MICIMLIKKPTHLNFSNNVPAFLPPFPISLQVWQKRQSFSIWFLLLMHSFVFLPIILFYSIYSIYLFYSILTIIQFSELIPLPFSTAGDHSCCCFQLVTTDLNYNTADHQKCSFFLHCVTTGYEYQRLLVLSPIIQQHQSITVQQ